MNRFAFFAAIALSLLTATSRVSLAADSIVPLPGLDACIAAALQQRPGILFGWKRLSAGDDASYEISVLSPDGKIGDTTCSASKTADLKFENRFGMRRYEQFQRITVPEASARATAPLLYAGEVDVTRMTIDSDLVGNLAYEYYMTLRSGHVAQVKVSTISGLLLTAEAKEGK